MFKRMLLGQWHGGLSDAQLEQALKVRIDFMVFTEFEPAAGQFPDKKPQTPFARSVVQQLDFTRIHSRCVGQPDKISPHARASVLPQERQRFAQEHTCADHLGRQGLRCPDAAD